MSRKIAHRQTLIISTNLGAPGNNFNQNINLRFSPDEVILRQLSYASEGDALTAVLNIYTDMLEDLFLCSFPVQDNTVFLNAATMLLTNFDSHFDLHRNWQNRAFNFQIQLRTGGLVDPAVIVGLLSFTLEFIRYE